MRSARINFGQPHTEYKLEINEAGEATSCYNQDTETEYIGGGGGGDFGTAEVTINNITLPSGPQPIDNLYLCVSGEADNDFPACSTVIPINNEFVGQPITVILYKGCQVVMLGSHIEGIIKNVTGSALLTANGLEITGNCSFDVDYTV